MDWTSLLELLRRRWPTLNEDAIVCRFDIERDNELFRVVVEHVAPARTVVVMAQVCVVQSAMGVLEGAFMLRQALALATLTLEALLRAIDVAVAEASLLRRRHGVISGRRIEVFAHYFAHYVD